MTQEALKNLLDAVEAAIQAGDWKVDGACDPDLVIRQAKKTLAQPEQEPVAIERMKEWIEYLKRKSDFGQHMKIPSEMSAGTCWELALELEQFINTTPPQRTEQEPLFKKIIDQHPGLAEELKALDEQEPVAWRWKERINSDFDSWVISASEPPPYSIEQQPLYTTPPQRKPLLASDIVTMYDENPRSDNEMIAFARAIEAAHGIKE